VEIVRGVLSLAAQNEALCTGNVLCAALRESATEKCKLLCEMAATVGVAWDWRGATAESVRRFGEAARARVIREDPRVTPVLNLPPAPAVDDSAESAREYLKWVRTVGEMERERDDEKRLSSLGEEAIKVSGAAWAELTKLSEFHAALDFLHEERGRLRAPSYVEVARSRMLSVFAPSGARRIGL